MTAEVLKRCSRCRLDLGLERFSRNKRTKDGISCYCKDCVRSLNRKQYLKNRDRRLEEARAYRRENAEALSARRKAKWADPEWQGRYWRDPDNVARRSELRRKRCADRYADDPDYYRKIREKYHESRIAWEREDRAANPEKYRSNARSFRENNPTSVRRAKYRRRMAERDASSVPYLESQWLEKLSYWGGRCWICRDILDIRVERDHVKPLSKGGMDCLANLRPCCRSCNASKGDRWPFLPVKEP